MTTNNTARISEIMVELGLIGNMMVAPYIGEDGKLILTPETQPILVNLMEVSFSQLVKVAIWAKGDRSYESWLEMFRKVNTDELFINLDETGRLRELSLELAAMDDLEDYYATVAITTDYSSADLSLDYMKSTIENIRNTVF